MWLKNVTNGIHYPYTDFLAQHYDMIIVQNNPFVDNPVEKMIQETTSEAEERRYEDPEVIEPEEEKPILKPRLVKPKGKTKK